ncbi:hypothetical protein [Bradyrhizobium sp. WD16]|uniref:hypothetical protein n=1 Tax=Bradyrhizobium sp. WD16 TaxID=1521768 RepID=UPI0020A2AEE7|nr:hypothetical protein [Bradyrhizobium sp. WD16]UTD28869.1 hypothetical protein DB459_20180 [Bradyrhizobium sp. WD16]
MPTLLPARRRHTWRESCDIFVLHLAMVPLSLVFLSTLLQGQSISAATLLQTLLRGAEAIAEAELGFGRGWMTGPF